MLRDNFNELVKRLLSERGLRTEIETNGSVFIGELCGMLTENERKNLSFTLDCKLPSSGMEKFMLAENYDYLRENDSVKFVCGDKNDLLKAIEIINEHELNNKCQTVFSPVFGKIEPKKIVEFIIDNKLYSSRFQLQLHKFIWNPDMRGV